MNATDLQKLPRLVTLHQLSRRSGLHRSAVALLMLRGQITPEAMMDVGQGREQFLFASSAMDAVTKLTGGDRSLL
jgi:hypothetical protein